LPYDATKREKWGLTILSQGARILSAAISQYCASGQNGLSPFLATSSLSAAVVLLLLTNCGYPGPVLPPLLDIPLSVPYVNAVEYGDKILVEFTLPDLTTEGNPLHNVRSLVVGVGPGPSPFTPEKWAETAKQYPVANPAPGPIATEIPAAEWVKKDVVISVRAVGPKGKPSQWATVRLFTVEPPLPTPTALKADNVEAGVKLTWQSSAPKYRIFRAVAEGAPERLADTDHAEYVDETTEYDKAYSYRVQAITDDLHGSQVTSPVAITPIDTFAPAVPAALTAILGVNTVELAWTRNSEKDFKGYNVYRSTDGGPFEKIADLIPSPTYSDSKIEPGKKYRYQVTAVDLKNNESIPSTPADASNQ
jgi:fibronectin type 3 domain-containing protein